MPVDINKLTEGWLELESDPGLFTLLLEDFGVKGVQVEEIYDLQKPLEGPIYGFIFLFRWIEERRSRRKFFDENESFVRDENIVNNIFFAQQMVPNSCATHALLSVLLNCPDLHLGSTLSRLKMHTTGMSPENKGWAIGNTPELACAHNSHAMPQARRRRDKGVGVSTGRYLGEAFHFVSYVPIRGRLFELDGLKPYPIDHGTYGEKEDWTEKFRRVMTERLGMATGGEPYHDIRFNLMAVVPDRRIALNHKLKILRTNRQIVLEALQQLVKLSHTEMAQRCEELKAEKGGRSDLPPPDASSSPLPAPYMPVLETHNYCKNPLVVGGSSGDGSATPVADLNVSTSSTETMSEEEPPMPEGMKKPTAEARDASAPPPPPPTSQASSLHPDYSLPLTIQTSPAPSSSSTDTSSEVGSAFNSPTQGCGWSSCQTSPLSTKDIKKFVVIRVAGEVGRGVEEAKAGDSSAQCSPVGEKRGHADAEGAEAGVGGKRPCGETNATESDATVKVEPGVEGKEPPALSEEKPAPSSSSSSPTEMSMGADSHWISKYPELFQPHNFAPKDLLALLKNLEGEIGACEMGVRDENDKRKKYKVDDSRRTHNYDEFVCTFLSMLAQQGKLADLVKQHLLLHKRPGGQTQAAGGGGGGAAEGGGQGERVGPGISPRIGARSAKADGRNTTRRKRGRPAKYRRRK